MVLYVETGNYVCVVVGSKVDVPCLGGVSIWSSI